MQRKLVAAMAVVALAVGLPAPAVASTPQIGVACSVKGRQVVVDRVRLQCVQRSQQLRWVRVMPLPLADNLAGDFTIFAAASLTDAFGTLARQFKRMHPKVQLTFSFAGSSALATQIVNGAPADVFASAAVANMQQLVTAKLVSQSKAFARNRLIVVAPVGNPARISGWRDLAKSNVKVAVCQSQVPCGAAAQRVFEKSGVSVFPVTYEPDVKSVLTKVLLGEVDAGLVYLTDAVSAAGKVKAFPIPESLNSSTTYSIALLRKSASSRAAQAFVRFLNSDRGAAALAAVGFKVL